MGFVDFTDIRKEQRRIAGVEVPVAVTPHLKRFGYARNVGFSLQSLAKGMRLTLNYLLHPSKIVTRQYPENRKTLTFPARFRALLRLIRDANGYHLCTACRMCERACPNATIKIITRKGEITGKNELDRYIWRHDSCLFCNACVQSCPFDALEMKPDFENAVYDRRLLIYSLNWYAGPPASVLLKEEDPQKRKAMVEPRDRYGGPVPMNGHAVPMVRPLPLAEKNPALAPTEEGSNK